MKDEKRYLNKKNLKRILGFLAAFFIFVILAKTFNYLYFSDDIWTRILWHHFYEDSGKIDNAYIGSSHVYSDINPATMNQLNGQYNFNLSTPAQCLNGSYYLLQEADRLNPLSHAYLELCYRFSVNPVQGPDPIRDSHLHNWINTDYMHFSVNKIKYTLAIISETNKYEDIFFPFIRYREKLGDWDYINEVRNVKKSDSYHAYEYRESFGENIGMNEYRKQGYFYSTIIIPESDLIYEQSVVMEENPLEDVCEEYIRKFIGYCQKNDIPITLFVTPIPDLKLISTENYDNYINQVSDLAREYQIPFYDFNLIKEEYLPLRVNEHFRDLDHLNTAGADLFTPLFYEIISGTPSENNKYFYASYADKLQSTAPSIYGIYYNHSGTGEERKKVMHIASNREKGMEYKIVLAPYGGEPYVVQDYLENKEFTVPLYEGGICTIEARSTDDPDHIQTLEIKY